MVSWIDTISGLFPLSPCCFISPFIFQIPDPIAESLSILLFILTPMSSVEKFLSDYITPTHAIISCELTFTITDEYTIVGNRLQLQQQSDSQNTLTLAGVDLELISISLDERQLTSSEYSVDIGLLTLENLPERFTLDITTKIYPEKNTALEGLFKSGAIYCTQNEPEGFRKITYFLDRPDVMTIFTTKIIAPKKYPILLSNGNLIDS